MRLEYLFHLARLCHVQPDATYGLTLTEFAVLTDSIDAWLKFELQPRG